MSDLPPSSGIQLDSTHFDCLLLGTSLTNTLLAAALAKLGKRVLHIDRNDYYGGFDTSLPFNDFSQLIHSAAHSRTQPAQSEEQLSEWRALCGDIDSQQLSFHHIAHSSPLYDATAVNPTSTAAATTAAPAAPLDASSTAPTTSHTTAATNEASANVPSRPALPVDASTTSVSSSPLSLPQSQSRLYSLDVTPHLLLSRAELVDALIASSTSSYIEFKAVDQSYLCPSEREGLQQVPVSRSAVFTSTLISVNEKRQLMRLLAAVMPNHKVTAQQEEEDRKDIAQWSERPFADWLQHRQLSPRLTSFVAYAIALLDYRQDTTTASSTSSFSSSSSSSNSSSSPSALALSLGCATTAAGIARMRRHFHSIARYSPGAFLYPIYGMGELPQAFARLCAVHGGIYILRYQPLCVVSELSAAGERRVKGVISDGQQLITADVLVCDREYVEDDSDSDSEEGGGSVSCAVCVVDGRVLSGAGEALDDLVQCVFPPLSVHDNQHPVRLTQLSGSVKAVPDAQYVLYLATPSTGRSVSAAHDLQPIIEYVTQPANEPQSQAAASTPPPRKPSLLHAFYYKRKQRPAILPDAENNNSANSTPAAGPSEVASALSHSLTSSSPSSFRGSCNVLVTADSSPLLPLDSHMEAAQLQLNRLAPGVSLLAALTSERSHDGSNGNEEKQQLDQLNILNSVIGGSDAVDDEDNAEAALTESENKEQASAALPSIMPRESEQQQQQHEELRHEPTVTSINGTAPTTMASNEEAVLASLDDLTFS